MKKVFSILIALFLLAVMNLPMIAAYRTTVYDISLDNIKLTCSENGVSLLAFSDGECYIEKLSPDNFGAYFTLNHTIDSADIFGDTVVALCNDADNSQLLAYLYRPDTDILDSVAINNAVCNFSVGFGFCGDSIYMVSDRYSHIVERYDSSGKLADSYTFNSSVTQLGVDYYGNIIAVSANSLYYLNQNRFIQYGGAEVSSPVTYFTGDMFTDASGGVFRITGDVCRMLFRADTSYGRRNACLIDDVLYYPVGSQIYGYDISTGEKISKFSLNSSIYGLYAYSGKVYAVCTDGEATVFEIHTDEFELLHRNNDTAYEQASENHTDSDSPETPVQTDDLTISSDIYRIDFDSYQISGIPAGTTLAQLKQNIRYDGFDVRFYRDGALKKSGKCGTAMTAVFDSDRVSYTFELSVIGDITGEGSVNSRDVSLLMEYLLETADFNGVYTVSADLSNDNLIDVKDLAMMRRMY